MTSTEHDKLDKLPPVPGHAADHGAKPRERFLGEASRILAESLDFEGTLQTVARLAVSEIADWCSIDLLNSHGQLTRVATEHRDTAQEHLVNGLHQHPPQPDAGSGAPSVVRTGATEYVPEMSELLLQERERVPERQLLLRSLGLNSTISTPLIARGRILGALTLSTTIGRQLTVDDVRIAEDLARRAAFAIDHARLYDEAQRAVRSREEILAIVSHDLRTPLSAVLAGASLLISVDSVDPDRTRLKQRGETIRRAALHMSRLIRDLTDLAQIDASCLAIDKQWSIRRTSSKKPLKLWNLL